MSAAEDLTRRVHEADKAATKGPWTTDWEDDAGWVAFTDPAGERGSNSRVISSAHTTDGTEEADADLIASYRSDAVVLARMVDDVLNRHVPVDGRADPWCAACGFSFPCPDVRALDRIAKEAGL